LIAKDCGLELVDHIRPVEVNQRLDRLDRDQAQIVVSRLAVQSLSYDPSRQCLVRQELHVAGPYWFQAARRPRSKCRFASVAGPCISAVPCLSG